MFENELELAKKAALAAGTYLRNCSKFDIDSKKGKDIKLSVDRESERLIIDVLSETGYSIIAEESGTHDRKTEYYWIVDPLDGTANYWRGMQELCCVSIALWLENEPILGVIYHFDTDTLFWGIVGDGAGCSRGPIHTSDIKTIADAFLMTGFPVKYEYTEENILEQINAFKHFKKIRMLGSAALMGLSIAIGRAEVYVEQNIMLWDIAASLAIVRSIGGCAELEIKPDYRCVCRLFANEELKEEYHGTIL